MRLEDLPEMTLIILKHNPMFRRKFMKINDIAEVTVIDNNAKQNPKSKNYVKELFYVIGRHRYGHLYVIRYLNITRFPRIGKKYEERQRIDYKNIETIFSENIIEYRSLLHDTTTSSS